MRTLHDRVAVVTGGGGGIGRETARLLAEKGCHVAVVDIDQGRLDETAALVRAAGRNASTHVVDVADAAQVRDLAEAVVATHGAVHVLVNNAGVTSAGAFEDDDLTDVEWMVGVNVWGVVNGCHAFLPEMRRQEEAHIVNVSSMTGLLGLPHNAAYALTKGAVRSFSESLRAELITSGVGVTVVFPGTHRTGITDSARGAEGARIQRMGRSRMAVLMRPPAAVAKAIVRGIERDRPRAVVGPDAHVLSFFSRALPGRSGLVGRLTSRVAAKP